MSARGYRPERDVVGSVGAKLGRDLCSEAGARWLAVQLDGWWHERGFWQVAHWAEPAQGNRRYTEERRRLWCVRSNLVDGLPPLLPAQERAA